MTSSTFVFSHKQKGYVILAALFCCVLIVTNFLGTKIVSLFSIPLPGSIVIYPLSFVFNALITEMYGQKNARFVVYLGFFITLMAFLFAKLIISLPPHPFWILSPELSNMPIEQHQQTLKSVFQTSGIALGSSLLAYLCAQLTDVFVFSALKAKTKGKALWLRTNVSIICSQAVDTTIVSLLVLFLGLKMELSKTFVLILTTYLIKIGISLSATPFLYLCRRIYKEIDHIPASASPVP